MSRAALNLDFAPTTDDVSQSEADFGLLRGRRAQDYGGSQLNRLSPDSAPTSGESRIGLASAQGLVTAVDFLDQLK